MALGTSKINYMDPRITVAWCGRVTLRSVACFFAEADRSLVAQMQTWS